MNNSNKLQAKDLVNVGIYSAIYLVITCVLSFLSLIPIFHPLLAVICPIAGGIPFMIFLTKSKKFGMITIMGIIMGIVMLLTGMGYFCLFTGPISAVVADLVAKSGKYISAKKSVLTCGIFSLWYIGNYLAVFITRGLGMPVKRTNICEIGFHKADIFFNLLCLIMLGLNILRMIGIF